MRDRSKTLKAAANDRQRPCPPIFEGSFSRHSSIRWRVGLFTLTLFALARSASAAPNDDDDGGVAPPDTPDSASAPDSALELGGQLGWLSRPATKSGFRYEPSWAWAAFARVAFTNWLGLRVLAGAEDHRTTVASGALGFRGDIQRPTLQGLRFGGELTSQLELLRRLRIELAAGAAWMRFTADSLQSQNPPLSIPQRSGVVVEIPISTRLLYFAVPGRISIAVGGVVGLALQQSGELFAPEGQASQALRTDTGELVGVGGFPQFSPSVGTFFAVNLHL